MNRFAVLVLILVCVLLPSNVSAQQERPVIEVVKKSDGTTEITTANKYSITTAGVVTDKIYIARWDLHSVQMYLYTTEAVNIAVEVQGSTDLAGTDFISQIPPVYLHTGTDSTVLTTFNATQTFAIDYTSWIRFKFPPDTATPNSGYEVHLLKVRKGFSGR